MSTGTDCFAPGGSENYMLGGYKLLLGQPSGRVGNLWKESSTLPKNLVKKTGILPFLCKVYKNKHKKLALRVLLFYN